jgi:hypothetical protein
MVPLSPVRDRQNTTSYKGAGGNSHSRKSAPKLMHISPFHAGRSWRAIVSGMVAVWISSREERMPCWVRKPTMILGTPRRKDWSQNLRSLRWKFSTSRWLPGRISADVLSSTQLIGVPGWEGLESQTGSAVRFGCMLWSGGDGDVLASTSPPIQIVVAPIPVRTTDQYWGLLLTTSVSLPSM